MFEPVKEFKEKLIKSFKIFQNLLRALGSCHKEIDMFVPVGLNNLAISTTHFETTRRDLVRESSKIHLITFIFSSANVWSYLIEN